MPVFGSDAIKENFLIAKPISWRANVTGKHAHAVAGKNIKFGQNQDQGDSSVEGFGARVKTVVGG